MAKFIERIALETYNYLEIHADDLAELTELSKFARNSADYKDRLHKEAQPSTPQSDPMPAGMQMSEQLCPLDGAPMKLRSGKFGSFYGCSNYPTCKGTRDESGKDTTKK